MKIIHCSDVHLDSRMESNLSAAQARERGAEICATFGRMVSYAVEQGVAAVLIAGDLFDTERVTARTAGYVMEQIRRAENVEFFYLRGNHDAVRTAFTGEELPENFRTFGSEWVSYERSGVTITGMELEREKWDACYDALKLPENTVNIVMLHGQTSTQPGEELVALPKLKNKNIDYLALGHIHSFQRGRLDDRGGWCYCGCLEGRGFDECGEKGFVLLDIADGTVNAELVPFAKRTLHEVEVDISGLQSVMEIGSAMEESSAGIDSSDLVKFTLRGTYTLETQKDLRFLKKMLEERFWFVRIKDETALKIEREAYEHDASLKGEFIRMVLASDRPQEDKDRIILWGIQALSGEEVAL